MELNPQSLGNEIPTVLEIKIEKKSSIMDKFKDTYNKEGNKELKSYVGYLGEKNSKDAIE